jgi:hypothetical protein
MHYFSIITMIVNEYFITLYTFILCLETNRNYDNMDYINQLTTTLEKEVTQAAWYWYLKRRPITIENFQDTRPLPL